MTHGKGNFEVRAISDVPARRVSAGRREHAIMATVRNMDADQAIFCSIDKSAVSSEEDTKAAMTGAFNRATHIQSKLRKEGITCKLRVDHGLEGVWLWKGTPS